MKVSVNDDNDSDCDVKRRCSEMLRDLKERPGERKFLSWDCKSGATLALSQLQ